MYPIDVAPHQPKQLTRWSLIMANSTTRLSLCAAAFASCLMATAAGAATIPDTPLQTSTTADPNIMMVLDDSGSMQFEMMPDDYMFFSSGAIYLFPRADGVYGSTDYNNNVATVNINDVYSRLTRSRRLTRSTTTPGLPTNPGMTPMGTVSRQRILNVRYIIRDARQPHLMPRTAAI